MALAWGGLYETNLFKEKNVIEQNYIIQINKDFKDGRKGTTCN